MKRLRQWLRDRIFPILGYLLIRSYLATLRVEIIHEERLREARALRGPVVFAFWHRHMLLFLRTHRNCGAIVLTSRSADGEMIHQLIKRLGFETVRGSSSAGGSEALKEMAAMVGSGRDFVFTPDGPRGPVFEAKIGAAALAARTGLPIVPVANSYSRYWAMGSWDRLMIPKPFARGVISFGEPIRIPVEGGDDPVEAGRKRMQEGMNRAAEECEAHFGR